MAARRSARLIETVLRCYPARWRRRHGDEAAELAALLIRDGTPAGSIAWSYLAGAAREWLAPRLGSRLSTVACLLLVRRQPVPGADQGLEHRRQGGAGVVARRPPRIPQGLILGLELRWDTV
jgi:hypothetical protein